MLNTSARNWRFHRAGKRVFFVSVKSTWEVASLRQPLKVRGELPKVYGGGLENGPASSHRAGVGLAVQGFWPFQCGRWPPPWEKVLLTFELTPSGPPEKPIQIAPTCQPPRNLPATLLELRERGSS